MLRSITGESDKLADVESADTEEEYFEMPSYLREFPPQEKISQGLQQLVARKVSNCIVFTGSEEHYNYTSQYVDSFSEVCFDGLLDIDYLIDSNHILVDPRHQKIVVERIANWLNTFKVSA